MAPAEMAFPNSAEMASTVASCAGFVDVVFDGGAEHGAGASGVLARGTDLLFTYVVVFETEAAATAMMTAVSDTDFDQCWREFNAVAAVAMPFGITAASYETADPPALDVSADAVNVEFMEGTVELGGTTLTDSCLCVFAQSGRAVVEVHSAEPVLDPAARSEAAQAAVDKAAATLDGS